MRPSRSSFPKKISILDGSDSITSNRQRKRSPRGEWRKKRRPRVGILNSCRKCILILGTIVALVYIGPFVELETEIHWSSYLCNWTDMYVKCESWREGIDRTVKRKRFIKHMFARSPRRIKWFGWRDLIIPASRVPVLITIYRTTHRSQLNWGDKSADVICKEKKIVSCRFAVSQSVFTVKLRYRRGESCARNKCCFLSFRYRHVITIKANYLYVV